MAKAKLDTEAQAEISGFAHSVYRDLIFSRKCAEGAPLLQGADSLDVRGEIEKARKTIVPIREGEYLIYTMLYTQKNLELCQSYLCAGSTIEVLPDCGLKIEG